MILVVQPKIRLSYPCPHIPTPLCLNFHVYNIAIIIVLYELYAIALLIDLSLIALP